MQPAELRERQMAREQAHGAVDDLILLPANDRMQRILAMPVEQQHDLLAGLPDARKQALLAGLSPEQRETVIALNYPEMVIDSEAKSAKLLRAVYSDRQLEEVLADFWFNHFNVFKGADRYLVTAYERDVIRPHLDPAQLNEGRDLALTTDFRLVLGEAVARHLDNARLSTVFPGFDGASREFLRYMG